MTRKKAKTASPAAPPAQKKYEPTPEEKEAIERVRRRRAERGPAPQVKLEPHENGLRLNYEHVDKDVAFTLLADALGTSDWDFVNGIVVQVMESVTRGNKVDTTDFNFILSVIKDIKPRDQMEAMLAAQAAAIHRATMKLAGRLGNSDNIPLQDSALGGLVKLSRAFTSLLDSLKRYRHGGEQRVIVQHVNVNDGGQAIVANVAAQPGRPNRQEKPRAAPALTHSAQAPMPMLDDREAEAAPLEGARRAKADGRKRPL